jgi:glycosyltransferase involved in cell wall biosynthesis
MGAKKNKVHVIYSGLTLEMLDKYENNSRNELFTHNNENLKKIITIGRFTYEKGMKFITDIAIDVLSKRNDVIWYLVGGKGPDFEYCSEKIKHSNLGSKLIILGQRNDIPIILKSCYIQVIGSKFEGLPLGVLEASYYGVPTIGPHIGGVDEAIVNFNTGLLVKPHSKEEFISAINLLIDNESLTDYLAFFGKKRIIEKFDSKTLIIKLFSFIESDLKGVGN